MTARKRKSPDRKQPVRQPSLLPSLLAGTGRALVRHPKGLFGGATFCVIFSFVAANALWYQPGGHPSPFLATRDAGDPNRIAVAGHSAGAYTVAMLTLDERWLKAEGVACGLHVAQGAFHAFDLVAPRATVSRRFAEAYRVDMADALGVRLDRAPSPDELKRAAV